VRVRPTRQNRGMAKFADLFKDELTAVKQQGSGNLFVDRYQPQPPKASDRLVVQFDSDTCVTCSGPTNFQIVFHPSGSRTREPVFKAVCSEVCLETYRGQHGL
jgi:hypothetical protein